MDFPERLKMLRTQAGMTQMDLSEKLGVSVVTVRCWELGSKKPSMDAIISISNTFNVTTDYILIDDKSTKGYPVSQLTFSEQKLLSDYKMLDEFGKKAVDSVCTIELSRVKSLTNSHAVGSNNYERYIPMYLTPSAAGYSVPLDDDNDFEMIPVNNDTPIGADYAVPIQGDSMYPYIKDGEVVYVKRDCILSNGDVCIFSVDGAMYCKQYYIDDEHNLYLVSSNEKLKHTNIRVPADSGMDVKCFGKVLLKQKIELPEYFTEANI